MEKEIPKEYNTLVEMYISLKKDYEIEKQEVYGLKKNVLVQKALLDDYEIDSKSLQKSVEKYEKDHSMYELKIRNSENAKEVLRSNYEEKLLIFQTELKTKNQEISQLKQQLENSNNLKDVSNNDFCTDPTETAKLLDEKNMEVLELKDQITILLEQNKKLEILLKEKTELIDELNESLNCAKNNFNEKSQKNEQLLDELMVIKKELDMHKNKPLNKDSRGNSLFAEVNERRLHLEQKLKDMKSHSDLLKNEVFECTKKLKLLHIENEEIRAAWKKDLRDVESDHQMVVKCLNERLKNLEQSIPPVTETDNETLPEKPNLEWKLEHLFYENLMETKNEENKMLKRQTIEYMVNSYFLSSELNKCKKELRLAKHKIFDFEHEISKQYVAESELTVVKAEKLLD